MTVALWVPISVKLSETVTTSDNSSVPRSNDEREKVPKRQPLTESKTRYGGTFDLVRKFKSNL